MAQETDIGLTPKLNKTGSESVKKKLGIYVPVTFNRFVNTFGRKFLEYLRNFTFFFRQKKEFGKISCFRFLTKINKYSYYYK